MDDTLRNGILSVISSYGKYTGLPLQFFPAYTLEDPKFEVGANCSLCKLIQSCDEGCAACCNQRINAVKNSFQKYRYQIIVCHADLCEWIAPAFYKGMPVGYFVSGFVFIEENKVSDIEKQARIYAKQFHSSEKAAEEALTTQMTIPQEEVEPMAQLLFALTRLNIPSGLKRSEKRVKEINVSNFNFIVNETEEKSNIEVEKPLSYYICENELDAKTLETFWKGIEIKASDIFMNIMAGRYTEGSSIYNEVMQMAYHEKDLCYSQISAEMLFHIITLKCYSKDIYDTRFYNLTFETIRSLNAAKNLNEVPEVMTEAFKKMYLFYNVEYEQPDAKNVSQMIIDYLEGNYSSDVRIKDIEKVVYMSSSYASKLFRKETHSSIKNCLVNIRMRHAQQLLSKTDMPIKDVAAAVGYSDTRGFYKMFAKHFGVTCSEMRENKIEK